MTITPFRSMRRKPLPVPSVVTQIWGSGFTSAPPEFSEVRFLLQRSKRGAAIYLHQGNQSWSLNEAIGKWPATFAEARILVQQVAASHGYPPFKEIINDRVKRSKGPERKAFKAGECREEWLSSDVPELWAEAMVRCQHPGGYCGQDGFCHYGDCKMTMRAPCA